MTPTRPGASAGGKSPSSGIPGAVDQGQEEAADAAHCSPAATGNEGPESRLGSGLRRDAIWFLVIFLTAVSLRGVYLYQVRSCPFFGHEIMDPLFHRHWGEAIAAGRTFMEGPYFRAPLYPWFLGAVYRIFGQTDLAPRIIQIVVGSLSCGLVYLIGRQAFTRRVGILAGLAAASYWMFLYFEAELLIVCLAVFLDLLLIWLLVTIQDRRSAWLWLMAGAVLGLSAIARPTILLFAPGVLIWLGVLHRSSRRRASSYAACFILGCALFIAPVTVRNYVVGGDRVLISSAAGVNFFIGNNPRSDGMTAIVPGTPAEWWAGYEAQIERAEKAAGRPLKASQVSQYYWREALGFMREQPTRAAKLMGKKLRLFWSRWEVSNNQDVRFVTDNFAPVVRYLPLTFWVVGPLGLLGLLISLGQSRRLFPLWGFVLIYMVGVVAFFVTARYRLPVVPILILLGSSAVFWSLDAIRSARWLSVGLAGAVLVSAAVLVAHVPQGVEAGMAQSYGSAGISLAQRGQTAEAEEYLLEAIERYEVQPNVWFALAAIRMQQGRFLDAERCLQQTLAFDPAYPDARKHLGFVLNRQGKLEGAISQFTRALESSPDDPKLYANLGGSLIKQGRTEEGLEMLRRGVRLDPGTVRSFENIGRALIGTGRFAAAVSVLEAGVGEAQDDVRMLTLLAKLLASCPDATLRDGHRALQYAERACQLQRWADPDALDAVAAAHYALGHVNQAIKTARRAMQMAAQQGNSKLAAGIAKRLRTYESALAPPGSGGRPTPQDR